MPWQNLNHTTAIMIRENNLNIFYVFLGPLSTKPRTNRPIAHLTIQAHCLLYGAMVKIHRSASSSIGLESITNDESITRLESIGLIVRVIPTRVN